MSSLRSGISESRIYLEENELLHRIWDRELWHSMVANTSQDMACKAEASKSYSKMYVLS